MVLGGGLEPPYSQCALFKVSLWMEPGQRKGTLSLLATLMATCPQHQVAEGKGGEKCWYSVSLTKILLSSSGSWEGGNPVFLAVPTWHGVSVTLGWEGQGGSRSWFIIIRTSKQKISKNIEELNNIIKQLDLIDIYTALHPTTEEYTSFSILHSTQE